MESRLLWGMVETLILDVVSHGPNYGYQIARTVMGQSQGYFELTNPAIALFILITGLHGLHLLGGLVAWGRTTDKLWRRDDFEAGQVRQSVELCTLYWHFMLAVWLVLFVLLFSGNDNLGILLALCGIR